MTPDLLFKHTQVYFDVAAGSVRAVDDVSARFAAGKITGLIGESGCGKSVLGLSVLGLLPPYARICGQVLYGDLNITAARPRQLRALRGRQIGLIPQSPGESLGPVRRIGSQIDEALSLAESDKKKRKAMAHELLSGFGFDDPERILRAYPFQLSGGMQQRALCAIGVCCSPPWIIADEPTKGLDKALCDQVCETLSGLGRWGVNSMLVITHDLDLASSLCNRIAVMYAGEIVEMGAEVLTTPKHPYTQAFLASLSANGMHPMVGTPPGPADVFPGCKFAPRCPRREARCETKRPENYLVGDSYVRCFLYA